MTYDFQKLADVELLEEVPDGASAFVAVDGTVKRVPGSGLGGGGGIATAILRLASESNASACQRKQCFHEGSNEGRFHPRGEAPNHV